MYMVSSRKGFWNSDVVSRKLDKFRDVDLRTGTSVKKAESDYKSLIKDRKVLILCHGYNNEPADVLRAYQTIARNQQQYTNYFDVVVGYTWPGGDKFYEYPAAKERASAVAPRFVNLLQTTMSFCSELAVMSHSMGCRVSLVACEELKVQAARKCKNFWQFMMAAAVDNESVESGQRYFDATLYADNTYVFHSKNDGTLSAGYRVFEWDRALGHSGPENVDDIDNRTRVINCKHVVKAHGDYKRTQQVYQYIKNELTGSAGPQVSTLR